MLEEAAAPPNILLLLLLAPSQNVKLAELGANKLDCAAEAGGGSAASLLVPAVSPTPAAAVDKLAVSPITVIFDAVSESVEEEDDVDSASTDKEVRQGPPTARGTLITVVVVPGWDTVVGWVGAAILS